MTASKANGCNGSSNRSTRDPDKKVVSVPMPSDLLKKIAAFARKHKLPLAVAINTLCRERLGMPPAPPPKKGGRLPGKRPASPISKGRAGDLRNNHK